MDCELDTHADTCCVRSECEILHTTEKADITGFLETVGKVKEAPIVTTAMALIMTRGTHTFWFFTNFCVFLR